MSEPDQGPWYETAFGELYPLLYAHRSDDAAQREVAGLLRLLDLPRAGIRALDLCCGAGRHGSALRTAGLDLVGIDLSADLLARASRRSVLAGRLVRGDMRRLPFGCVFDLVVNLFTSFGYFAADEENERVAREMARVLRPGGGLVIDHIHRARLERELVPEDERRIGDHHVRQHRQILGNRIRKRIEIRGADEKARTFVEDVRLYRPEEMTGMLTAAGMAPPRLYGSLSGRPFDRDAERMVLVAHKAV